MGNKKNVALLMGILENDFCAAVLEGAVEAARERDVNLLVFPMDIINGFYSEDEMNRFRYQYNTLSSLMCSDCIDEVLVEYGTLVSSLNSEEKKEFLAGLGQKPIILLSEEAEGYPSVGVENSAGMIELMDHLILEHGYRKIAHLAGTKDNSDAEIRKNIYIDQMKKHSLYQGEEWIIQGNFSPFVEDVVTEFFQKHPDVEAIVCGNDAMAMGAGNALKKLGKKPGVDVFLTGFDDNMIGLMYEPAITTVLADPVEITKKAMLSFDDEELMRANQHIPTKMVKRESCGCTGFVIDEKRQAKFGISLDWRDIVRRQIDNNYDRRNFEYEMSNITREMIIAQDVEKLRYEAVLKVLKRLHCPSCAFYLYDEYISHKKGEKWVLPEYVNLAGFYMPESPLYTFEAGVIPLRTTDIFFGPFLKDEKRHEMVVFPLFFGETQMGLIAVECDYTKYVYIADIAGHISNALHIVDMNLRQEKMQHELEEANKAKSQFLANMSHEIRTPINAIMGFNEMILRENRDKLVDEYASDVKQASETLLSLVNSILDFSKIEAGRMDLVETEYHPLSLAKNAINMVQAKAESKGLDLIFKKEGEIPEILLGDDAKLQQILVNLLTNSVKYTHKGSVMLMVSGKKMEDDEDYALIRYVVRDTGIGIKESDIESLFTKFKRIEELRNRNIEGTGLGINIVSGLLELMGSKLEVRSSYGEGSEFYFEVKQKIVYPSDSLAPEKNISSEKKEFKAVDVPKFERENAKILVVDDNAMNRKVISRLLGQSSLEIDLAESGFECIEMVKQKEYQIILLDHMMPEKDGIATLHEMREQGLIDNTRTKVVALTANAIAGSREMYLSEGFDEYLSKPVRPNELYDMLNTYFKS